MGFIRNLRMWLSGSTSRQKGLQNGDSSGANASTKTVTPDVALQLSAYYACVRLITNTIAALPIVVYDVDPLTGEWKVNRTHRLSMLLNGTVNRWQTRQEYMETIVYQFAMLGNDYSIIHRNLKGEIVSLEPLMTPQMEVELLDSGAIQYRYNDGATTRIYAEKDIWHNKAFGNGIVGLNPLSFARQSLGIAAAAEDSVAKVYANGGKPSGVLYSDKVLTPEQRKQMRGNIQEWSDRDGRVFVLEAGYKWDKISLTPSDIELLASRKFQIEDIARWFGVPSVLINDTGNATVWGSGISEIVQGFHKFGLKHYTDRYAANMQARLLTPEERTRMRIEFDYNALLMPGYADRVKTGKEAVTGALITINEWRKAEGLPPVPGGDEVYMQQQMVPVTMLETIARPAMEPKPEGNQNEKQN